MTAAAVRMTKMTWPNEILERFRAEPLPSRPGTWRALCPAHDDSTPSLSLWTGRNGCLLVGCWAGCAKERILACKGLKMGDLFPPSVDGAYGKQRRELPPRRVAETYDYADERGTLLYQAVRYEPKDFSQRRPLRAHGESESDPVAHWAYNLEGVRLVLYRLPELLRSPACVPVLVAEGERKADRLRRLGLAATCNVGGCGMGWLPSYSLALRGRRVVVLPDCDAAGAKHAFVVAGSLMCHGAASVRIVPLPGLGAREDVVDWLARGNTKQDLIRVIGGVPEWKPG
jgi:putative DNA primase/helicase